MKKIVKIPVSRKYFPLLLIFSLALTGVSVYLIVLPFTAEMAKPLNYLFMAVGAVGACYFIFAAFGYIYQLFKPNNAMVLGGKGMLELVTGGTGAGFIPWSNIARADIVTVGGKKALGIELADVNEILNGAKAPVRKQITANMENRLPHIIIKADDIGVTPEKALVMFRDMQNGNSGDEPDTATKLIPTDEVIKAINAKQTPEPIAHADDVIKPAAKEEEKADDKSVDELLAELAESLKRKTPDGKDETELGKNLQELIDSLNKK